MATRTDITLRAVLPEKFLIFYSRVNTSANKSASFRVRSQRQVKGEGMMNNFDIFPIILRRY